MDRASLSSLVVLATVAARRSFRGAALELGLSPSAVSHAVGSLEARLGVRLLARTTRSVAPTEAGQRLIDRLEPALMEIDAAIAATDEAKASPSGTLRLTVPRAAVPLVIAPRLDAFTRAYPEITLELHTNDGLVDIVAEGFDAGLRFNESLEKDMVAARFGPRQRMIVVGAPALFQDRAVPRHPHDLAEHRCIGRRFASGAIYRWELEKAGEAIEIAPAGPLILNDDRMIVEAAISGVGVAFVFEGLAEAALAQGQLIPVLEDWCPDFPGFLLYYPSRRYMRPALRALIDFYR